MTQSFASSRTLAVAPASALRLTRCCGRMNMLAICCCARTRFRAGKCLPRVAQLWGHPARWGLVLLKGYCLIPRPRALFGGGCAPRIICSILNLTSTLTLTLSVSEVILLRVPCLDITGGTPGGRLVLQFTLADMRCVTFGSPRVGSPPSRCSCRMPCPGYLLRCGHCLTAMCMPALASSTGN